MIIYNVTVKLDRDIHQDWLQWMKEEHVPEILATNCFNGARLSRLLDLPEDEGYTYSCQYFADSKKDYEKYISQYADELRNKAMSKFKNKFTAFRTLMEESFRLP